MIIEVLKAGVYKKQGTIRYKDGKVTVDLETEGLRKMFAKVYGKTPKDGLDYMNVVLMRFTRSTGILLVKEDEDEEWLT